MRGMVRLALLSIALVMLFPSVPVAANGTCALCFSNDETDKPGDRPLIIEITSGITFSRLALTGDGLASVEINPVTGEKRTTGAIMDLGGSAVHGRARISGMPRRAVRISMPARVAMTSATGGTAELSGFTTDLPVNAVLDSGGYLEFSFGGSLKLNGATGGALRGRIPISVEYD